jgi:hypothetical protein
LSIVEKTGTFPDEMIHITPGCAMHFHGHWNKVVPFMKPSILVDLNNGIKFHSYTCWSTNDIWNHCLPRQISNHHIHNEDLVLLGHLEISLKTLDIRVYHRSLH